VGIWTIESLPGVNLAVAAVVPEPGTGVLLTGGLLALAGLGRARSWARWMPCLPITLQ
jgi:hypothetical protein